MIGKLFRRRGKLEPVARQYLDQSRYKFNSKAPLAQLPVVVLDAETTGFDLARDRILSVATVEVKEREILIASSQEWIVYQPEAAANAAVSVHGILPSETAAGTPEKEVLGELLPLLGTHLVVGHHIAFDLGMLDRAAHKHFNVRLRHRAIDTALLAMQELEAFRRSGYPNQKPPTLDEVCSNLDLPVHARHTASGDAYTTAEVFILLCARIRHRLGRPVQLRDLGSARL
ncbi:MAG: 3'-5' exonuclease [Verrucomicrobiota bacterium JB022]|nr:3'-5' exonuclease [Verrucomicrobiota bacterium JB022]